MARSNPGPLVIENIIWQQHTLDANDDNSTNGTFVMDPLVHNAIQNTIVYLVPMGSCLSIMLSYRKHPLTKQDMPQPIMELQPAAMAELYDFVALWQVPMGSWLKVLSGA